MGVFVCPVCGAKGDSAEIDHDAVAETAFAEIERLGIDDPPADEMAHHEATFRTMVAEYIAGREGMDISPVSPDDEYSFTCINCSIRENHRGRSPMWMVAMGIPTDRDEWDSPGPMADMGGR